MIFVWFATKARQAMSFLKQTQLARTLSDIHHKLERIMSAISDFAAKMTAFTDRQDKAVADLQGDVKSLQDQIAALQASPGTITPEDQALLDGIQAHASTVADKLDALDALTPPAVPPTP
jgi:hypothetical protein